MNKYLNLLNSIELQYNETEQNDFNFYDDLKNLYKPNKTKENDNI